MRQLLCAMCLCCLLGAASAHAISRDPLSVDLPEVEMMPGSSWFWVGQHMALNGVPMSVKAFTYKGRIDDIAQFYRNQLRAMGHGKLRESKLRDRVILGYQLGEHYYTIQMDRGSGGQIQGKVVVTPTALNFKVSLNTELPLPPRTKVISVLQSLDAGRRSETVSASCSMDVGYVVDFYVEQLAIDGWKLFSRGRRTEDSSVISFQRGAELLQLTVKGLQANNSQSSQFLINWAK